MHDVRCRCDGEILYQHSVLRLYTHCIIALPSGCLANLTLKLKQRSYIRTSTRLQSHDPLNVAYTIAKSQDAQHLALTCMSPCHLLHTLAAKLNDRPPRSDSYRLSTPCRFQRDAATSTFSLPGSTPHTHTLFTLPLPLHSPTRRWLDHSLSCSPLPSHRLSPQASHTSPPTPAQSRTGPSTRL
jgi:hypothetical protein